MRVTAEGVEHPIDPVPQRRPLHRLEPDPVPERVRLLTSPPTPHAQHRGRRKLEPLGACRGRHAGEHAQRLQAHLRAQIALAAGAAPTHVGVGQTGPGLPLTGALQIGRDPVEPTPNRGPLTSSSHRGRRATSSPTSVLPTAARRAARTCGSSSDRPATLRSAIHRADSSSPDSSHGHGSAPHHPGHACDCAITPSAWSRRTRRARGQGPQRSMVSAAMRFRPVAVM